MEVDFMNVVKNPNINFVILIFWALIIMTFASTSTPATGPSRAPTLLLEEVLSLGTKTVGA
jgi:hypothetical protein